MVLIIIGPKREFQRQIFWCRPHSFVW